MTVDTSYHTMYVQLHGLHKGNPGVWTVQKCTRVLDAVMAGMPFTWHVVGITPAALQRFAELNFRYVKGITRGHLQPRIERTRQLLAPAEPLGEAEFLAYWLRSDKVVLCAKGENKAVMPVYIPFANADARLFTTTPISWRHRQPEQDFLRDLYAAHNVAQAA